MKSHSPLQIIALCLLMSGCVAGPAINSADLEALKAGLTVQDVDQKLSSKPIYRLDYLIDGYYFRLETYQTRDTARDYSFLYRNGTLLHVTEINRKASSIRSCTRTPPDQRINANECLKDANRRLLAERPVWNDDTIKQPNDYILRQRRRDTEQLIGTIVGLSPIVVPAAVIALPVAAVISGRDALTPRVEVRLGDRYEDIARRVDNTKLIVRFLDNTNLSGTAHVPGKGSSSPVSAFGFQDGIVNWIAADVDYGVCKGTGLFSASECGF